jgi:UDP-N-acetylmuramate dehydrogenase
MMNPWDRLVADGQAQAQVSLAHLTTYKMGGPASYLVEIESGADLEAVALCLAADPRPVLVMGRGSNVVVSEEGFDGVVIHLGAGHSRISVGDVTLAQSGAGLPVLARTAAKQGWLGLEFMVGIPGSVGGGVRQNAGCFGAEIADVLIDAEVFDLDEAQLRTKTRDDLDLKYRHSSIGALQVVVSARFSTVAGDPARGESRIREITRWRRLHQPGGTLNAGSVFKNPAGDSAGRIIDSLGFKGTRVGGASVSDKHANFFVAMPGTGASDVYLLVKKVARAVSEASGIELEPEIQFAGNFAADDEGSP